MASYAKPDDLRPSVAPGSERIAPPAGAPYPIDMTSLVDLSPPPPCPTPFNMAAHVLRHADRTPDKIALSILGADTSEDWTYGQLAKTVFGLAGALRAEGFQPGDRVLMRLGNTVEFPLVYLAAIAADLIPVPTSAQLTTPEITKMAAVIKPALIVAGDGVALPDPITCPVITEAALHDMADHAPLSPVMGDPDRPAYIIFTSGTSGTPRGVVHGHRAIWARQMMVAGWYGLTAQDRLLHAGAFNWTYTLGTGLMDPWAIGATALIPAQGMPAAALPQLLDQHDATIFAAAPGVYRQMLRAPLPKLARLRHGLSAGEKMPTALRDAWTKISGTPVHEAFGMSECSTFLSGCPDHPAPDGALGYPQPGRRIALLGEDGQPVPINTPGVIAVDARDPGLMLGYLDAPQDTAAKYSPDGAWFVTGDMAQMAPDGAITYLGRDDDMMNAGGFRVSPIEVESALITHPAIDEAAATEVTVKAGTSVIAAFYVAPAPLDPENLAQFAAQRLARYKCPRLFVHMNTLPRGGNGKLLRKALRDDYQAHHDPA